MAGREQEVSRVANEPVTGFVAFRLGLDGEERRRVARALQGFAQELAAFPQIEAVAFLRQDAPHCPTSLSMEILLSLTSKNHAEATRGVEAADGRLAEQTAGIIPMNFQFVDTTGKALSDVETQLREGWSKDPEVKLVGFLRFQ